MFKTFQHAKVSFLIGGLEAWKEAGGDIESGEPQPRPRSEYVSPGIDRRLLATQEELLNEISDVDHESVLVDVRGGCVYESGHIPTFINIPVSHFIHDAGDYTQFKSAHEIQHLLQSYNIHPGGRTVFSCNSGMMASIATLARASIGEPTENTPMYDGSWSEWVLHPETNPIEISPPEPVV
jgi:thiosulfate/3-mercaptopyruvate sulfurtransferase